jgi:hypothetical protein
MGIYLEGSEEGHCDTGPAEWTEESNVFPVCRLKGQGSEGKERPDIDL